MCILVAFPWPVASANLPLVAISSRSLPQLPEPARVLVTTGNSSDIDRRPRARSRARGHRSPQGGYVSIPRPRRASTYRCARTAVR